MKRINNLYAKIISIENLRLADTKASKGKSKQYGVEVHKKQQETNIFLLHEMLLNKNSISIASYNGWLKHANCINLKNKLLYGRN